MKSYFFLFALILFTGCTLTPLPEVPSYPETEKLELVRKMPKVLRESSGLIYHNQEIWTVNDGGNGAYIFRLGLGKKNDVKKIEITNLVNVDWESLGEDEQNFYIGDFGNNRKMRLQMEIHLIDKKQLFLADEEATSSGSISFIYPEYKTSVIPVFAHNFNCEAMVVGADSIYIFSKNHFDLACTQYRLPKTPGKYVAEPVRTFPTYGLITGAAHAKQENFLVLLGYNRKGRDYLPFVWVFSKFPENDFFAGEASRVNLPDGIQAEGIAHFQGTQFLITCEKEQGEKAGIYLLDVKDLPVN